MSKGSFGFTKFGFSRIGESLLERFPNSFSSFKSSGASTNAKPSAVTFVPRILSATKSYVTLSTTGGNKADMIINLNRKTVSTKDTNTPFSKIASYANAGSGLTIGNTKFTFENGVLKVFINGSANPQLIYDFSTKVLSIDANGDGQVDRTVTLCFMSGTMILTPDGERAIETLKAGDIVITADGNHEPIRWVGTQQVSKTFADPLTTMPVLVKAGALGEGMPRRDLYLSPSHALFIDGTLAQAGALVNGRSIVRFSDTSETFVYYNIELGKHDLILAEGVAAETFVDNASRRNFDNWADREVLDGNGSIEEMDLPLAKSARQVPMAIRQKLSDIAMDRLSVNRAA